MHKFSPGNLLVAAVLFAVTAESAWSQETVSSVPAAAAGAAYAPGYAPAPYSRWYEPSWQPPPWPELPPPPPPPPPFYDRFDPYYPPAPQYRSAPRAPVGNPLSAELKQTQQQLATKNTELDAANEQLGTLQTEQQVNKEALLQTREQLAATTTELDSATEKLTRLQVEQQAMREIMQQAQAETAKASEQLSIVTEEMDILYEVLSELKARLDLQKTSLQGAVQAGVEDNAQGKSAVQRDDEPPQAPATKPAQPGSADSVQPEMRDNEPTQAEVEQRI